MTKEEFKSRIEDIIDDNRIYGWDTVEVLIMEEIDKTLPPFNVDWEKNMDRCNHQHCVINGDE